MEGRDKNHIFAAAVLPLAMAPAPAYAQNFDVVKSKPGCRGDGWGWAGLWWGGAGWGGAWAGGEGGRVQRTFNNAS